MKNKIASILGTVALAGAFMLPAGTASAAEAPTYDDLTAEQKQAIAVWEAPKNSASAPVAKSSGSSIAAASSSTRTSLYRGSWLMWANERVDFGSTSSSVSWSSGFQESGAVFPNNVTRKGTSRIYTNSSRHTWRGGYTVGAGVPTPWGNANVYNADSTATTNVYRAGGWNASWSN